MKKNKFVLSITAAAALLFTSAGAINADAASIYPKVETKVFVYQSGNVNADQLNSYLQKYLNGYQINWNELNQTPTKQSTQATKKTTTIQKPTAQTQKKAPTTQKPVAQAPSKSAPAGQKSTAKPAAAAPTSSQVSSFEQQVVNLTNQERAKQGLPALKLDTELSKVARAKSQDMKNKGYFSHTSPTYGSPFDMMKQFGISYKSAGENIAMGQASPQEVVTAWMNSEGHRANILNGSYTHIGVGHVANGNYWTQMFISK